MEPDERFLRDLPGFGPPAAILGAAARSNRPCRDHRESGEDCGGARVSQRRVTEACHKILATNQRVGYFCDSVTTERDSSTPHE